MSKCPVCKKEQTVLVRLLDGTRIETNTITEVCENKDCPLYINASKVRNWNIKQRGSASQKK